MKTLSNLVRDRYNKWCENDILQLQRFGVKTLVFGAKSILVRSSSTKFRVQFQTRVHDLRVGWGGHLSEEFLLSLDIAVHEINKDKEWPIVGFDDDPRYINNSAPFLNQPFCYIKD